ncbi:MAG: hypothetical protein JWM80_5930 [Cyanobacteria bacterium RYN_339]|nr:hypothetical protein [Cyanobacteria bacterium RYN_339]
MSLFDNIKNLADTAQERVEQAQDLPGQVKRDLPDA